MVGYNAWMQWLDTTVKEPAFRPTIVSPTENQWLAEKLYCTLIVDGVIYVTNTTIVDKTMLQFTNCGTVQ